MELRVLRYFLTVAREENITRAAALLHVTQPTLSRQLMQLEDELGVKLFHRSRYRIVLTDDGMLLRQRAFAAFCRAFVKFGTALQTGCINRKSVRCRTLSRIWFTLQCQECSRHRCR